MHGITIELEPNEKYYRVVDPVRTPDNDATDYEDWDEETQAAADAYVEKMSTAPTAEDFDDDPDEYDPLTWDDISPSSDPDLLAKIATYFDGMGADEPTDRLRAKCRLLDVEVYVDAQIAARAELRET
jgi:hypothetical protein